MLSLLSSAISVFASDGVAATESPDSLTYGAESHGGPQMRRRLGGTFSDYPEGFGENALSRTQTVVFTVAFAVLAILIAMRIRDEDREDGGGGARAGAIRKGNLNNRHMVIACIFLGSSMRVVYIPIIDLFVNTPGEVVYVFRLLKDLLWFTAFSLLVAFWMEIQVATSRNTFTVSRYRLRLIAVISFYSLLRILQMVFEIKDNSSTVVVMKGLVGVYLLALFGFSGPACSTRRARTLARTP